MAIPPLSRPILRSVSFTSLPHFPPQLVSHSALDCLTLPSACLTFLFLSISDLLLFILSLLNFPPQLASLSISACLPFLFSLPHFSSQLASLSISDCLPFLLSLPPFPPQLAAVSSSAFLTFPHRLSSFPTQFAFLSFSSFFSPKPTSISSSACPPFLPSLPLFFS
jgi:hypothetical protein